jgi:hypothetical protein
MRARCPKNEDHKLFITVIHVMQDVVVDEYGKFEEEVETLQTTHGAHQDNTWTCKICGTEAIVE